jgi:peptidyl-dipeptidase A
MVAAMRLASALSLALFLFGLSACGARTGGSTLPHRTEGASRSWQEEADDFLDFYDPTYRALYTESARAAWLSSTDVSEEHTGGRAAADTALYAFAGSAFVIERARALLAHREELDALTARQLDFMLILAAQAPQLDPELARRRVAAEAAAAAALDGFEFCMARDAAGTCTTPTDPNAIDGILVESRDLSARLSAWNASKEVGTPLRSHLLELRDLRNGVARAMGYDDYFALMVSNYGMSTDELMALLDQLIVDISPPLHPAPVLRALRAGGPLWRDGTCPRASPRTGSPTAGARPGRGSRTASTWTRWSPIAIPRGSPRPPSASTPRWASRELPDSFWTASDLYPVPAGDDREKNDHAQRLAHGSRQRRAQPDERGEQLALVHHRAPRARAHLLLHELRAPRGAVPAPRGRQPQLPRRASAI